MAYDTNLAIRVRRLVADEPLMVEKKMFGGLGFILAGNMACGVNAHDLIVRIDPKEMDDALAKPGARIFDMSGRPMKGWLLVDADACADDAVLQTWVDQSLAFARTLPAK